MLDALHEPALAAAAQAYVPYSQRNAGAVLLLSDGSWVAGARVESSSYPLTITALQAAFVRTATLGRLADVVAAAWTPAQRPGTTGWIAEALQMNPVRVSPRAMAFADTLPRPTEAASPWLDAPVPTTDDEGLALARAAAARAHIPESHFPVGCVLVVETASGMRLVEGVNVEHADWTRGLCAERTALATLIAAGGGTIRRAFLSCPLAPGSTPCGACRQVLAEHLPETPLVIEAAPPRVFTPAELLPYAFTGDALPHRD